jgi:hypothetical protein
VRLSYLEWLLDIVATQYVLETDDHVHPLEMEISQAISRMLAETRARSRQIYRGWPKDDELEAIGDLVITLLQQPALAPSLLAQARRDPHGRRPTEAVS